METGRKIQGSVRAPEVPARLWRGGHTRCEINAEENWSAAHSALIASFELCRNGIPSKWKDRLSAQGLTMQPFKVSVEIANALINGAPETTATEAFNEYSKALLDQFAEYIAKVMKMLEENPNEEPGEEQATDAALLPNEALGEGHATDAALLLDEAVDEGHATDAALLPLRALGEEHAIAAAPLQGEALVEEKFVVGSML